MARACRWLTAECITAAFCIHFAALSVAQPPSSGTWVPWVYTCASLILAVVAICIHVKSQANNQLLEASLLCDRMSRSMQLLEHTDRVQIMVREGRMTECTAILLIETATLELALTPPN